MKTWMKFTLTLLALGVVAFAAGCTEAGKHEVVGTLAGGALGAGTGAIIGNQSGHAGTGTAIGAGAGALAGNVIGRGIDEASRSNERNNPPAGYTYPPVESSTNYGNAPPGVPPPPPPPGHYEWDPSAQRWIWRYDRAY